MASNARSPLRAWIWRAFVHSSLIPLVLVESVLIAAYLLTNVAIRDAQIGYLEESAIHELGSAVARESSIIDSRLNAIEMQTRLYRDATAHALLDTRFVPDDLEVTRHAETEDGVFYTRTDDGRAASFYPNSTPRERQDRAKALRLSQADPVMRSLKEANPLIGALYFNTFDSYNRIYPFFMTPDQYPHDMVIPDYNFYYLADAKHNPERKVVWTDVYLDPAGLGWMMSAIAPVYREDFLEGVVGLDITVSGMLKEIAGLQVPWNGYAMLVSRDNNIMALPPAGERDFKLSELTEFSYEEAVAREVLKPEDFKLDRQSGMADVLAAMAKPAGVGEAQLNGRGQLVAWSQIPQTGWRLLMVVDEAEVFADTEQLASRYRDIGYLLIAGLVVFYVVFFFWMWLRSRRLSGDLATPMAAIIDMMRRIGKGDFHPKAPDSNIHELQEMGSALLHTGEQLESAESARSAALRRLEIVLEGTTESLWEYNVEAGSMAINGRFVRAFGLDGDVMTLADFNERVHPDDLPELERRRTEFMQQGGERFEAEYRFANAQGRYAWLLSRGQTLARDVTGKVALAAGTHIDITRIKEVEQSLRKATREAEAASIAKSRFLASVSHELRTPLNAIYGFAQLLDNDSEEQRESTGEILRASKQLTALVDDILDLSGLESGEQRVALNALRLQPLMRECADAIQADLRRLQLQFDLRAVDEAVMVVADERRLRQVLMNLLSNAIKYNRQGGLVALGAEVHSQRVRIWVDDTGSGLTEEQQALLFQPFQRLGRENSNIPGSGIGLVLCRELADAMHGEVGLSSTPGTGSRFWIELPRAESSTSVTPEDQQMLPTGAIWTAVLLSANPEDLNRLSGLFGNALVLRPVQHLGELFHALEQNIPDLLLADLDAGRDVVSTITHLREDLSVTSAELAVHVWTDDAGRLDQVVSDGFDSVVLRERMDAQWVQQIRDQLSKKTPA